MLITNLEEWINPQNIVFVQKDGRPYYNKKNRKWKEKYGFKLSTRIVKEKGIEHPDFKRVAYASKTTYFDHFVIDADCGANTITQNCKTLFNQLGISPLYITGTDNPKKPHDSASIIIFFKPIEKTEQNHELFTKTIHVFNLFSGGDLLNVGYQHKNPWLEYLNVHWFAGEPQKENLPTLEYIYAQSCKYWNIQPHEVEDTYKKERRKSFDQRLEAKLGETNPEPTKVKSYWDNSNHLPQFRPQVQPYLNIKNLDEWVVTYSLLKFYYKNSPEIASAKLKDCIKTACQQRGLNHCTFIEATKYRTVKNFHIFAITGEKLWRLGFSDNEIQHMIQTRNEISRHPRTRPSENKRTDFGKKHHFKSGNANNEKTGLKYTMKPHERKTRSDNGKPHNTQKEHTYIYNNATYTKSELVKTLQLENETNLSRKFKTLGIVRQK